VSDRLVDAVVAYGDPAAIAAKVREHLAAGADHLTLLPIGGEFTAGVDQLEQLAPELSLAEEADPLRPRQLPHHEFI
jgi:hypothetical protein